MDQLLENWQQTDRSSKGDFMIAFISWTRSRKTARQTNNSFCPTLLSLDQRIVPSSGKRTSLVETTPVAVDQGPRHSGVDAIGVDSQRGYPLPPGKVPTM